jgi:tRNA threonylcarbamoyladenosine biosynthesis protein TsaE
MITYDQSPQNLSETVQKIKEKAGNRKVWLFYGDMGAGKTTLIKNICTQLGCVDEVTSPTFSIINEYQTNDQKVIYHIDLYRLNDPDELLEIGLEEVTDGSHFCFVEWPQIAIDFFPSDCFPLQIEIIDSTHRKILFL